MIISASRRTDIPAFFSDWFFQRIKEGFVHVRNPMNANQISRVRLTNDVVDGIVFWTKNPQPMLKRLNEIDSYPYYFQFTLNSYGQDIELNVQLKNNYIIPTFQELSKRIGKNRVIWRYDPIFINKKYTLEYHYKYFEVLVKKLHSYTEKCTVSFINFYKKTKVNMKHLEITPITEEHKYEILKNFLSIASAYGLVLDTCAENINSELCHISHARCVDSELFEKISGFHLNINKDHAQRMQCNCMSSIDIGAYGTCPNGCLYCYANDHHNVAANYFSSHNQNATSLSGDIGEKNKITERKMKSCKIIIPYLNNLT